VLRVSAGGRRPAARECPLPFHDCRLGYETRIPLCRFYIDNAKSAYNLMATKIPEVGQTVLLEGSRFVVRSVVPVPTIYHERTGYEAYVFCQPALNSPPNSRSQHSAQ
jgi:hypothetical protein